MHSCSVKNSVTERVTFHLIKYIQQRYRIPLAEGKGELEELVTYILSYSVTNESMTTLTQKPTFNLTAVI